MNVSANNVACKLLVSRYNVVYSEDTAVPDTISTCAILPDAPIAVTCKTKSLVVSTPPKLEPNIVNVSFTI